MTEFLIGCTHFGHENIIRLANRPFDNIDEMDLILIDNWNSVVGQNDVVYHLGDFAYKNRSDNYKKKLNGNIHFIQGNHDPRGWGRNYMELKRDGRKIVLFHYPIEEWNGWFRDSVHFHCHTHKHMFSSGKRRGNVGVDAINFTPIELDHAVELALQ